MVRCLAGSSPPCCPSPPLLRVWMNVSLTPWLSDFHTSWFSVSSGYLCVFKFVVVLLLAVWGTLYLPKPPSWPCMREILISCLSRAPNRGLGPKPRHVPWPRVEPATFCFAGQCPTHWAMLVRAFCPILSSVVLDVFTLLWNRSPEVFHLAKLKLSTH